MCKKLSLVLACLLLFSVTPVMAQTSTTTILIAPFCEGNSDCDADVDGTDASTFKADFGRGTLTGNPCMSLTDCPSNPWQPCPEGMIVCGPFGFCADPMTDEANCGGCNVICSDTCVNGTCQQVGCPPNFTWCDSECADTTTDESNCGSCGNECQSGQVCVNGACKLPYTCSGTLSALGRWCDQNNETVKDMTTGLVWLKDAGCMGYMDWYSAIEQPITNLRSGDCSGTLTDGSVWGDWRLPTKSELVGITVGDEYIRSSQMYFFTNVQSDYYWSSTTVAINPTCAWSVYMDYNRLGNDDKYYYDCVWPVRGGQ